MYNLDKKVRYVNLKEYRIKGAQNLLSFIKGSLSQNYDIDVIFIDSLYKITTENDEQNEFFFKEIENISLKHELDFYLSVSADKNSCPSYIQKYI